MHFKRNGGNTFGYLTTKLCMPEEFAYKIAEEWIEKIEDYNLIMDYDILYADSIYTLERVKKNNHIFFLTSRINAKNLLSELKLLKIIDYAEDIKICNPLKAKEIKTQFIHSLSSTNENIIMIGDTEVDYSAAKACECMYYILNRGFRSKDFWEKSGVLSYPDLSCV